MKPKQKYHIQQTYAINGAVACLGAVLHQLGWRLSSNQLRRMSRGEPHFSFLQILKMARSMGLKGKGMKTNIEYLRSCHQPCILNVVKSDLSLGVVVFYGYDPQHDRYWIGNPEQRKIIPYTESEVEKCWTSKSVLVLTKSPDFESFIKEESVNFTWLVALIKPDVKLLVSIILIAIGVALLSFGMGVQLITFLANLHLGSQISEWYQIITALMLTGLLITGLQYVSSFLSLRQLAAFFTRLSTYTEKLLKPTFHNNQMDHLRLMKQLHDSCYKLLTEVVLACTLCLLSIGGLLYYQFTLAIVYFVSITPLFVFFGKIFYRFAKREAEEYVFYQNLEKERKEKLSSNVVEIDSKYITAYYPQLFERNRISASEKFCVRALLLLSAGFNCLLLLMWFFSGNINLNEVLLLALFASFINYSLVIIPAWIGCWQRITHGFSGLASDFYLTNEQKEKDNKGWSKIYSSSVSSNAI